MASTAALIIFVLTFAGVALTRLPWVRLDRPAAAFLGAVAMVLFGVMTPFQAVGTINWDTISLLLGMMVIQGPRVAARGQPRQDETTRWTPFPSRGHSPMAYSQTSSWLSQWC